MSSYSLLEISRQRLLLYVIVGFLLRLVLGQPVKGVGDGNDDLLQHTLQQLLASMIPRILSVRTKMHYIGCNLTHHS